MLRWDGEGKRLWTDAPVTLSAAGSVVRGTRPRGARWPTRRRRSAGRVRATFATRTAPVRRARRGLALAIAARGPRARSAPSRPRAVRVTPPAAADEARRAAQTPPQPQAGKDDRKQPVTVDSDKMERFGKESLVVFTGNVVARQNNSVQYAERMEVYLDEKGDRILRTVSTGNVRIITRDCRTGTARRAEYHDLEQRVVLSGNARVWQEDNVVSGESDHDLSSPRTARWCRAASRSA